MDVWMEKWKFNSRIAGDAVSSLPPGFWSTRTTLITYKLCTISHWVISRYSDETYKRPKLQFPFAYLDHKEHDNCA